MTLNRRDFIALLGGAAAGWPLAARAQQVRRLGVLINRIESDPLEQGLVSAFEQELHKLGWSEGQNLHTEYRWNAGDPALARSHAAELIGLRPDVILSQSTVSLAALQRLSPTAPIVFVQVSDPVTQGFVVNMASPGGNITGFASYEFSIGGKWLDLLKQLVPTIRRVAVVFSPETPQTKFFLPSIEAAAPKLDVSVTTLPVQRIEDIEPAIAEFSRQPNGGLILPTDGFTSVHHKHIIEVVARYRVPAISNAALPFVQDGGLMSYGPDDKEQFRQAAVYVDRILKGAKAGDLPVQTATKFSLAINLNTARALGIEIPLSILLTADEQIE
jgi:putative ABC transport system substrate-binding protein